LKYCMTSTNFVKDQRLNCLTAQFVLKIDNCDMKPFIELLKWYETFKSDNREY